VTPPPLTRNIKKEGTVVITLDDLENSYPDDGDHCCYCGHKWDSHSPWGFFYLDNHLLCEECAPEYRRARSRRRRSKRDSPEGISEST
jgi:hypothetical protein